MMNRTILSLAAATAVVGGVVTSQLVSLGGGDPAAAAVSAHDRGRGHTIVFDAKPQHIEFLDLGTAGLTAGDTHTFSNDLYARGRQIGRDGGSCVTTRVTDTSAHVQCLDTIVLKGGQLTVQFSRVDPLDGPPSEPFTGAVTGGTGKYTGASGTVTVDPSDMASHGTVIRLRRTH